MPVRIVPPPVKTFKRNGRSLVPKKRSGSASSRAHIPIDAPKRGRRLTSPRVAPAIQVPTARPVLYGGRDDGIDKNIQGKHVLMYGWELPPYNSGGLGVASYGLAKGLTDQGVHVTFVLPHKVDVSAPFPVVFANETPLSESERKVFHAYAHAYHTRKMVPGMRMTAEVQGDLMNKVIEYAKASRRIAKAIPHDVIHAHDWLCFPSALVGTSVSHKPLVTHIHATEHDRSGGYGNPVVASIEEEGCQRSDRVIAVSDYTRKQLIDSYHIPDHRVDVVYNGVDTGISLVKSTLSGLKSTGKKLILFVGRITMQKGPDYFLRAASIVAKHDPNVLFVMAGSGDMEQQMVMLASHLGISDRMLFVGFLRDKDLASVYKSADLFVMPSVSEPFGIAALESMSCSTPVLISKQSGVAELVRNALKVDFWDTEEMAHKMLAVLQYQSLKQSLSSYGAKEVQSYTWERAARECMRVYSRIL